MAMELFRLIATLCLSIHTLCGIAAAQEPSKSCTHILFLCMCYILRWCIGRDILLGDMDRLQCSYLHAYMARHVYYDVENSYTPLALDTNLHFACSDIANNYYNFNLFTFYSY